MRMYDLIQRKKEGKSLSTEEIREMIRGYTKGVIPDYQMSAMLMSICFQGMDDRETYDLTMAMRDSGEILDLSGIYGLKADKHSTGGVGDKTTLVLAPILGALGLKVAKMSGRGLGFTGGTIDKLECFPGFSTAISMEQFIKNVNSIGLALAGQTANLAPGDKKLYALRDVTATVDQMSLIAGSIMSKKLAAGSDIIVLDVKTGSGAFMKTLKDSKKLAETMVDIGTRAGKRVSAIITDMDQPLGYAVGNSLEVIEAIEALSGGGPKDLMEVVYALGAEMLLLAEKAENLDIAEKMMVDCVESGRAKEKFAEFILAQGGEDSYVWDTEKFPKAAYEKEVCSKEKGFVTGIEAERVGNACMALGGGRETKEGSIDLSVGIVLKKKKSMAVEKGEVLAVVYGNDSEKIKRAEAQICSAYKIGGTKPAEEPMIKLKISPRI
ncbi:MAG: thymidine phosphorylase [Lachnospiraceae bacterium]|nr:thymidine phosphorylase [Lachnospiraceae bacterium]